MPELAEVEYYRKQWDSGLAQEVLAVQLHPEARIFRGMDVASLRRRLPRTVLQGSFARGKQMLFSFSGNLWLGLHLGMTGRLRTEEPGFQPARHDHLVLRQSRRALVFTDPRQFGRILFQQGDDAPAWWLKLPEAVTSEHFTLQRMAAFLQRHARLPIKAALLLQEGFPGIGNWMADEILWRAGIDPRTRAGRINGAVTVKLWRTLRWVSRRALAVIGKDFSDPPAGWLFHARWSADGACPVHGTPLRRATVGGRTTAWCVHCQTR